MRTLTIVLASLLLAACTGSSPGSAGSPRTAPPTAVPSPTPTPEQSLAALVDFPTGTGPQSTGYDLALVGTDGHVAARTHAAARTSIGIFVTGGGGAASLDLPEVSASNGRVYFLDGDQNLRSLTPAGPSGVIATLPGSATAHAAFAVSPDGQSIAVSVLTYSGSSASVTSLYVQSMSGGSRRDITHGPADLVWPVAWHGSDVVLAQSSTAFSQQGLTINPYFAAAFHVVDPNTSNGVATIGGPDATTACEVTGLLVPAGTACLHQVSQTTNELSLLDWTGTRTGTLRVQRPLETAALGPSQPAVAICCDGGGMVQVARGNAAPAATALTGNVDSWPCWLDDQHVLSGSVNDHQFQPGVLALSGGGVARVDAHGFCAAVLGSAGAAGEPM